MQVLSQFPFLFLSLNYLGAGSLNGGMADSTVPFVGLSFFLFSSSFLLLLSASFCSSFFLCCKTTFGPSSFTGDGIQLKIKSIEIIVQLRGRTNGEKFTSSSPPLFVLSLEDVHLKQTDHNWKPVTDLADARRYGEHKD